MIERKLFHFSHTEFKNRIELSRNRFIIWFLFFSQLFCGLPLFRLKILKTWLLFFFTVHSCKQMLHRYTCGFVFLLFQIKYLTVLSCRHLLPVLSFPELLSISLNEIRIQNLFYIWFIVNYSLQLIKWLNYLFRPFNLKLVSRCIYICTLL